MRDPSLDEEVVLFELVVTEHREHYNEDHRSEDFWYFEDIDINVFLYESVDHARDDKKHNQEGKYQDFEPFLSLQPLL